MVCPNLESSFQGQSEAKQFQIKNDNCSNRAERQLAYSQSSSRQTVGWHKYKVSWIRVLFS